MKYCENSTPKINIKLIVEGEEDLSYLLGVVKAYKTVTSQNPSNDRAWDALGNVLNDLGRFDEAITAFENAIGLAPRRDVYHYHMGIAYAGINCFEDAIASLHNALALNPEYASAHCTLARYYRELGLEEAAQKHLELAEPKMQTEKAYNRACFESISGNIEKALEFLRVAVENRQAPIDWIRRDPDLDSVRRDPRFKTLVRSSLALGI